MVPIAIAVLGTAGAFATTSMQKATSAAGPQPGYVLDENDICNVEVKCDTNPTTICKHSDGQTAFGWDAQENCNVTLYQPLN
ncbi:hypothetical protein EAG11_04965 [Flavobacterium sp. 140616W15]|nr:hypothetical protein EAG11_04965 [Flavobacterium sp. 140616W15]